MGTGTEILRRNRYLPIKTQDYSGGLFCSILLPCISVVLDYWNIFCILEHHHPLHWPVQKTRSSYCRAQNNVALLGKQCLFTSLFILTLSSLHFEDHKTFIVKSCIYTLFIMKVQQKWRKIVSSRKQLSVWSLWCSIPLKFPEIFRLIFFSFSATTLCWTAGRLSRQTLSKGRLQGFVGNHPLTEIWYKGCYYISCSSN